MKLLITGDLYIADEYDSQPLIDNSITDLFSAADYRIVNLEAPLTARQPSARISKTGPYLQHLPTTVLPFLKQLSIDLVTLANNHIYDYGHTGLMETFHSLKEAHIEYVGAGINLEEARRLYSIDSRERIAILNFCENEWSTASSRRSGANPMDVIENVTQIKVAKSNHDRVICIVHGGHEYCHLPSPRMVKQYRFYAESGADAIIGHHTHCIGGYEVHNGTPILYGLGNFLFTLPSKQPDWFTGLIVVLTIQPGEPITFDLTPISQDRNNFRTTVADATMKETVSRQLHEFNTIISQKDLLEREWRAFVLQHLKGYLFNLPPLSITENRWIRTALYLLGFDRAFLNRSSMKKLLNLIRCESHLEALKAFVEDTNPKSAEESRSRFAGIFKF